jgi:predicted nucleotidyltransferase
VSPERAPKDRDFVETPEGFLFCLVGYLHPPDRYMAYLKYTPADTGKWARDGVFYRRELPYYHTRSVVETLAFLERQHPRYVWRDPVQGVRFSFVDREAVSHYYRPEERLARILKIAADPLEEDVAALVRLLERATGVPAEDFGITGSVLLGLHDPAFSDIDLLVYGASSSRRLKEAIPDLTGDELGPIEPARRSRWRAETAARFVLGPDELAHLESRRWHYFRFRDRYVSVHATRRDSELSEVYGQRRYQLMGVATIDATIRDASESLFLPAVYALSDARSEEGTPVPVGSLVSYEGLFADFADAGDRIRARGGLEQISDGSSRLVVGTAALPDGGWICPATARRSTRHPRVRPEGGFS